MRELRYIRLPNPTRKEWTGGIGTDLDRAIAAENARGSNGGAIVYSARNRFRPELAPQAASDPDAVVAGTDGHALHLRPGDSQSAGSTLGIVHRGVLATLRRMKRLLGSSANPQDASR